MTEAEVMLWLGLDGADLLLIAVNAVMWPSIILWAWVQT